MTIVDNGQQPIKRQKLSSQKVDAVCIPTVPPQCWIFSHEVLRMIFQHLSMNDMIDLSCVNKSFRKLMKPYIFHTVILNWRMINDKLPMLKKGEVQKIANDSNLEVIREFIEVIKIVEPNLKQEWNFRFHRLFNTFPNLQELVLNIESSSNFLKYNNLMKNLKILHLRTSQQDSDFNLNNLRQFPLIKDLTIERFCIDFDPIEDLDGLNFNINNLTIINCSWKYPFKLSFFQNSSNIQNLNLIYSNQFIISERFKEFLNEPNLPNLETLTISNQNHELKLHITYKIFNFLQNIPNLKKLYLIGNIYNETLNHFTHFDEENKLKYCLNVNDVKIFYSSFIQ